MQKEYSVNNMFFYKEHNLLYLCSLLGSSKVIISKSDLIIFIFYVSCRSVFFLKNRKKNTFLYFNHLFNIINCTSTTLIYGYRIKFGPRGKRVRIFYNKMVFFFKLGYSSRIPFVLPLNILSFWKEKRKPFFTLVGLNFNILSNTVSHISSFRSVDPYNYGGIMLRDGFFKYSKFIK